MTPAAERALRLALSLAQGAVRELILVALDADAEPAATSSTRSRKALNQFNYRQRRRQHADNGVGNALPQTATESGNALPAVGGRGALSLGISEDLESEIARGVTDVAGNALPSPLPGVTVIGELCLDLDTELSDTLRAIAQGASGGPPVEDIDGAWRKFCGHWTSQTYPLRLTQVRGRWAKWCVDEAARERRFRDAKKAKETELAAKSNPAESPAAREERRKREASRKEAIRNAGPPTGEAAATLAKLGLKLGKATGT